MIVLHSGWGEVDLITFDPIKAFFNQNDVLSSVDSCLESRHSASRLAVELNISDCCKDLVSRGDCTAQY